MRPSTRGPPAFMRTNPLIIAAGFCLLLSPVASGQNVNVTATAGTTSASYATLKGAFDAINSGTHQGDITIGVQANTNEGPTPATLNSTGAGSTSYTSVSIRPTNDGVTITGNPAQGFGVIQLNGTKNVTIDGDNPNTPGISRNLSIQNSAPNTTTFGSVVRIATSATAPFNAANNVTIKDLVLNGNVTHGNSSSIVSNNSSSNRSFGIVIGPNGGSSVTALTSVTTGTASGVTVNNLTIDNNAINQCARGISFLGGSTASSTGVIITNNTIGASGTPSPAIPPFTSPDTTVYVRGIYIQGTNAITISGNLIRNILSYLGGLVGVELNSNIGSGMIVIANNVVDGIAVNGANSSSASGILVSSAAGNYSITTNTVSNIQSQSNISLAGGISVGVGSATIGENKISTVYNRNTLSYGSFGINVTGGDNDIIRNNFVWDIQKDMSGGGFFPDRGVIGIRIAAGTGHKVYHNTVNLFGRFLGIDSNYVLSAALSIDTTSQTGVDVRDNLLSNTTTGGAPNGARVSVYLPENGTSAMNLTLNNNAYYCGSDATRQGIAQVGPANSVPGYLADNFNASTTTPSTNLRSYTSTLSASGTNDNASIATTSAAPFVSNTDLHISSGTVTGLKSGGAAVGVTSDIDGEPRNPTTPDIGADEFSGTRPPANDIAAIAIVVPANQGFVANGSTVTPQATFRNVGTVMQTNKMVQFTITGPGGYNYSNTQTIPLINPNQLVSVTFGSTPIFSMSGTYNTTAAMITGDSNPANDTTSATFQVTNPLMGNVNVGAGADYPSLTGQGGLFAAVNAAGLSSNLVVNIVSDLIGEAGSFTLNQWTETGVGGYTINVRPIGMPHVINGSVIGPLIKLNGASRVTIDGSIGGTGTDRSLTIENTSTTTPTGVFFASIGTTPIANDTLKNCIIRNGGSTIGYNGASSAVLVHDTAVSENMGGYFSNITIQNNRVEKAYSGIFVRGQDTHPGPNVVCTQNDLDSSGDNAIDVFAVYLRGVNGGVISNNSVGNFTGAGLLGLHYGIYIYFSTTNLAISGNTITAPNATGTVVGMHIENGGGGNSNIDVVGNVIANIVTNGGTLGAISLSQAGGVTIEENIIQHLVNMTPATPSGGGSSGISVSTSSGTIIKNNFISDLQATMLNNSFILPGNPITGIGLFQNGDVKVYNNSVNLYGPLLGTSGSDLNTAALVVYNNSVTNCDVRNNIFSNTITGGSTSVSHVSIYLPSGAAGSNIVLNNNAYYNGPDPNTQGLAQVGTAEGMGLYLSSNFNPNSTMPPSNFRSYSSTLSSSGTNDNASLASTAPAPFVSPNDLHLVCDVPVRNAGAPIAAVSDDFDDDPRDPMHPDIGADEQDDQHVPMVISVVSRKVHGGAGMFDINLPLIGSPGVECRSGGATGDYQIVVTFASPVTVGSASVSAGVGSVLSASGDGTNTITVNLTGVANGQYVTVTLACTSDGLNAGDVPVTMGVLIADSNGNRSVNATDVAQTQSRIGQSLNGLNFRSDINANGSINASDVSLVKLRVGTALP